MTLRCTRASPVLDQDDFACFLCSDGSSWCDEAENHVRVHALNDTFALAFRDDEGRLVAVSSFNPQIIDLVPVARPEPHLGWHLEVVAVQRDRQRNGTVAEVFATTFARMREFGPDRLLVSAVVHRDHRVSRLVAGRAGLEFLVDRGDGYIVLLSVLE